LTSAAVKQAAAALNIPYSAQLEQAVMAQARAQALSQTAAISVPALPINSTPAMIIPKSEPLEQSEIISVTPVTKASLSSLSKKRASSPEDESEEVILKRAKNTDAARRSRLKKLLRLESLENKVSDLESTNNRLTMKVAILETEKNGHLVREAEQSARIAQLEAKLAEAHAALTNRS
jgi:predicted XRE-type DNA-binding protein